MNIARLLLIVFAAFMLQSVSPTTGLAIQNLDNAPVLTHSYFVKRQNRNNRNNRNGPRRNGPRQNRQRGRGPRNARRN
jgi:hypothetical protein